MENVFYKDNKNGKSYRLKIFKDVDIEYVNQILDVISPSRGIEFIKEKEWEKAYKKTMVLDVMDEDSVVCIGELETEWIDLDDLDDGDVFEI